MRTFAYTCPRCAWLPVTPAAEIKAEWAIGYALLQRELDKRVRGVASEAAHGTGPSSLCSSTGNWNQANCEQLGK